MCIRDRVGDVEINASDGVDFEVNKGEFVVIVGPSGAGKTTILNLLGGMDKATSGQILVDGQDVAKYSERQLTQYRRDDIGFVFQFYNLVQNLTALENVELATQISKNPLDVRMVLERVGLNLSLIHILKDCSWRSDLTRVEQIGDNRFIEYDRKQRETKIFVTDLRENIQFDYDVENNSYRGHWSGQFAPLPDGGCRMYLNFDFEPQSILGKFVRVDKFEERYIEDLKKELNEY